MSKARRELVDAIEASFAMLPETEGLVSYLKFPGIRGHETVLSHPTVNMITSTSLTSDDADAVIERVRDHFACQGKAFGWVIGPSATPQDLGSKLLSAGLTKMFDAAGMAMTDLSVSIRTNPSVHIREVAPEEMVTASRTMGETFPAPADMVRLMCEVLFKHRDRLNPHIYLAYLDGVETPVACSSMESIPGTSIVHLRGAATRKEHRGKGIYAGLLARRLADARQGGAKAAVIQAIRSTSAPVCRRLGFIEVCDLQFYTWPPGP